MRNIVLTAILFLCAPAAPAVAQLGCASRVQMSNFRPLEGAEPERRVLGYLYDLRNLTDEALLVQPSFAMPAGGTPFLIQGAPVMLRPKAAAVVALPADATLVAGQYGLDLPAITRATRASCTLR